MTTQQMTDEHSGRRSHRDALLREGLNQFFDHGYHGTTVEGLLDATGVPKGSFYHHFGSKELFAAAVLDRYGQFQRSKLAQWAARDDLTTADRLVGYFGELRQIFMDSGYRMTDLAGKLATEVAATSDPLHAQIARIVSEWRSELEEMLRAGQARSDVRTDRSAPELSAAIHALVDGAFVIAASTRDQRLLDDSELAIHLLLDSPKLNQAI